MSSEDVLLNKADQLMRRQRSFVASPRSSAGEPEQEPDDLPLLTEVVSGAVVQATQGEGALRLRLAQLLLEKRAAMVSEFERWLDEQLPLAVTSVMDGFTDRLVALITRRARTELLPRLAAIAADAGERAAGDAGEDGGQPV